MCLSVVSIDTIVRNQKCLQYMCIYIYIYIYICVCLCVCVCVCVLIYLLACSITLMISNTTCYLHLIFTIIVSSLLFDYFVCVLRFVCLYI